jgi:hypothetical protein
MSWELPGWGKTRRDVMVGTEEEWRARLTNLDDEDEYESVRGFLEVANDPSLAGRKEHPNGWPNYVNTVGRAPNDIEIMHFMRALYSLGGSLDLPNTVVEGGPFVRSLQAEFAGLISREAVSGRNVGAVAQQGGAQVRQAMLLSAGATAMKGIDLVVTANQLPQDTREEELTRETARRNAFSTIRNAGRTMKAVLAEHDVQIAFEQKVIGTVFDSVWSLIPSGGRLASQAKDLLKLGLSHMIEQAAEDNEPHVQAERLHGEFVLAVNSLVPEGYLDANDANGAINGFESVK